MILKQMTRMTAAAVLALGFGATQAVHADGRGSEPSLGLLPVATNLSRPLYATHAPGDYTRLFIVEQYLARVRVYNIKSGTLSATPFLDINSLVIGSGNERGLLGLAFHPQYQTNGKFYVNYNNNSGDTVVQEFMATSPDTASATPTKTLLTIDQPQSNHNGGWIGFGPDGMLYIACGDGGGADDDDTGHTLGAGNGQDATNNLLGAMLRIDVDGSNGAGGNYGIPSDNPFLGADPRDDEIWAFGLRNPWRNSFDRETGDFYIADVGQGQWEEINFQPAASTGGENYGWRCREGAHNFNTSGDCSQTPFTEPFHEYNHFVGDFKCSITGGYVYRGCVMDWLDGAYFFADYCSGDIWTLRYDNGSVIDFTTREGDLDPSDQYNDIVSFGEDAWGEMYVVDLSDGVYRIVPQTLSLRQRFQDFDCDGEVGVSDFFSLLQNWGPCVGCKQDIDGNDVIDTDDFFNLLQNWG
jgi:glucose/arabinose dehydrogenase